MLRISKKPAALDLNISELQAAVDALSETPANTSTVAAGNAPSQAPTPPVAQQPAAATELEAQEKDDVFSIDANHTAQILPWLTAEITFNTALDLGCIDGKAIDMLVEASYEAHGVALPGCQKTAEIKSGSLYQVPFEDGYFDCVMCCDVFHNIPNRSVSALLGEIDRLSNSYIMITTSSTEADAVDGEARNVAWWAQRIEDFGWRYRLLREDPALGQCVILAEKPDSLAAQILPMLDRINNQCATVDEQYPNQSVEAIIEPIRNEAEALVNLIVSQFNLGENEKAYGSISGLADLLLGSKQDLTTINPIFNKVITAMENQDNAQLIEILNNELAPALGRAQN